MEEQFKRIYNDLIENFKKLEHKEPSNEELQAIRKIAITSMAFIKAVKEIKTNV